MIFFAVNLLLSRLCIFSVCFLCITLILHLSCT